VSFVEADGPDFESFRIAVLFGRSGITFVVMGKEVFSWLEGLLMISIRGSALPSPKRLRAGRSKSFSAGPSPSSRSVGAPHFFSGFHHTRREMLTLFLGRVDNPI
jgi:hypothetical protein